MMMMYVCSDQAEARRARVKVTRTKHAEKVAAKNTSLVQSIAEPVCLSHDNVFITLIIFIYLSGEEVQVNVFGVLQ